MARSSSSFTKRQKERARQEKQREKAERKVQRKLEKQSGGPDDDLGVNPMMDLDDEDETDAEAGGVTSSHGSSTGNGGHSSDPSS